MEQTGLVLRPFIGAWPLLLIAALALALSLGGYARTTRAVSRRFRLLLLGLRIGALAAVLLCLLRPSFQVTRYDLVKRPLVLLLDRSRSMSEIRDMPAGYSRLEVAEQLLAQSAPALDELGELYDVSVVGFARGLLPEPGREEPADRRRSAYGTALERGFAELAGGQGDALVVIGDGSHNMGPPDPVEVAAGLSQQGVPVYTVGVGQGRATSELRDVKVLGVDVPRSALLFTSFPVRPELLLRGCAGLDVRVRMEFAGADVQEQTVKAAHDEEIVPLEFELTPEAVGEYRLTVRAERVPGEVLEANNVYRTYVRVESGGIRAGLFDTVRPESKFIAAALAGAPQLAARRVLALPGQELPADPTDPERYDVIVLGDLPASALLASRRVQIASAVRDRGKGLVALLSTTSAGAGGWTDTVLGDLLPVRTGRGVGVAGGERRFRVAPEHADHPAVVLGPNAGRTLAAWADLPPLAGALTGVEPKRGATVLARDEEGNPLLVVQRAGAGRVACVMADTTFRWFFTERETQDAHRRFWRQLVMWAAGREQTPQRELRLELSHQRLLLGEELAATVRLHDAEGEAIRDAELGLTVSGPDGQSVELLATFSRQEGAYVSTYRPAASGDYTVTAEATRGEEMLGRDRAHFYAGMMDMELEDPIADLSLLRRIAAATAEAGGRYYDYRDLGDLFARLKQRGEPLKLTTRRREDVWDAWPMFAVFAALLGTEWVLRKWQGLI